MQLQSARVTNFRCVEDSEEFGVDPVTCLVGKNEAGKTALLQALWRMKPHTTAKYDVERDYPRRHLADFDERHPDGKSSVLETKWSLSAADKAAVMELVGPAGSALDKVTITTYMSRTEQSSTWSIAVDDQAVAKWLLANSGLHEEERALLQSATTTEALRAAVAGAEQTERHTAFLARFDKGFKRRRAVLAVIDLLEPRIPSFMYFSNYDTMKGRVHLETLLKKKSDGAPLDSWEALFISFCEFAGTSLENLASIDRFEVLKSRFEAAQTKITNQIFEYWSSNSYLSVQFSRDPGLPADPAPFNTGRVFNIRVWNDLHGNTVPFDERSAGFVWFFSFLVLFSQMQKRFGKQVILLLDEPGLNLHAQAQGDLLRFIEEKLAPDHQVLYTTHSLFMVPPAKLQNVRIVEDVVVEKRGRRPEVKGTKVRTNVLSVTKETLFPLQGALGFEISQTLFIGKNSLIVEGPSDLLYFTAASQELAAAGRAQLDPRWTICPVGGLDKVPAFLSLFAGNRLNVVSVVDLALGAKAKVEAARRQAEEILGTGRVLTFAEFTGTAEADVEDMFGAADYVALVNATYSLTPPLVLPSDQTGRVLKWVEEALRLRGGGPTFNHFGPSDYLVRNRVSLFAAMTDREQILSRFEALFVRVNGFLS